MKKILLLIASAAIALAVNAAPQKVDFGKLPKNSQEFIQKNFPGEKVKAVEMDREASWDKYTVYFQQRQPGLLRRRQRRLQPDYHEERFGSDVRDSRQGQNLCRQYLPGAANRHDGNDGRRLQSSAFGQDGSRFRQGR